MRRELRRVSHAPQPRTLRPASALIAGPAALRTLPEELEQAFRSSTQDAKSSRREDRNTNKKARDLANKDATVVPSFGGTSRRKRSCMETKQDPSLRA